MKYRDAVAAFLTAKRGARRSPRTIRWYEDQLACFARWRMESELTDDIAHLTPFDIDRYLADCAARLGDASLHARYRALRSLCNWLDRRGLIARNPIAGVEEPKRNEKPLEFVKFDEFQRFLTSVIGDHWVDHRDRLIVEILFWSGVRVSELCALTLQDIDTTHKLITVRSGKGGKARLVPLAPNAPRHLATYLYSRPPWVGRDLWLGNDGNGGARGPLTVAGIQQMLKRRCERAGLRNLHPHLWRHGFGTEMLNAGADKAWVQSVLGHTDSKTTDRYARWLATGIRREFEEVHQRITHNI